jgi:hypothetical protein
MKHGGFASTTPHENAGVRSALALRKHAGSYFRRNEAQKMPGLMDVKRVSRHVNGLRAVEGTGSD